MVAIRRERRSRALGVAALGASLCFSVSAWAGEDDLVLDLGSASDKPTDAGPGLRKLELRRIPKGTFVEGSPASDAYREPDEVQRTVTISKTFWMSKYPVTRAQFARFVAETRHQTDAEKGQSGGFGWDGQRLKQDKQYTWRTPGFPQTDDDPVSLVTFGDANAFTAWASRKTGRRVRLPTEAEFEYSARAGTTTPWYAAKSEEESNALGWYRPQPGQAIGSHPVGKKKPNAWGLFDMTGNVNQWCRDVYALWSSADVTDPENTTNATNEPERRVLRGGSWMRDPRRGRSAARYRNTPGTRNADNGFRVVVEDAPVIAPAPGQATSADLAPSATPAIPPVGANILQGGGDAGLLVQATPVIQRPPSSDGISWGFFAAPGAAIAFVTAWMLARRKKEDTSSQGITTRAGDDGFYVRAPNLSPNSRVRYTCIVNGREVSDIVALEGGSAETFVSTAGPPSLIHIVEAIAVPASAGHRSSSQMPAAPSVPPPLSAHPPLSGSPPSSSRMPAASAPPISAPSVAPPISAPSVASRSPSAAPLPPPSPPLSAPPAPRSDPSVTRPGAYASARPGAYASVTPHGSPSTTPLAPSSVPLPPSSSPGAPSTPPAPRSAPLPVPPAPPPSASTPPVPAASRPPMGPSSSRVPVAPLAPAPFAPSVPPAVPSSARALASAPPAALPKARSEDQALSVPPPLPSSRPAVSGPPAPPSSRSLLPASPPSTPSAKPPPADEPATTPTPENE